MREAVFVDTGFWVALLDKHDNNHKTAISQLDPLFMNHEPCISEFILFETITFLNCTVKRHDLSIGFLEKVQDSGLSVIVVDEAIKAESIAVFKKYSDKSLSFTDCTSFVIMVRDGIHQYAGFDSHFKQMSFRNVFHGAT